MTRFWLSTALIAATSLTAPATAQNPEGYWTGALQINGTDLPIGINIVRAESGELTGTLDSPAQKSFDIPLGEIEASGMALSFTVPAIGASFRGEWDAGPSAWKGSFRQGGMQLPLVLAAGTPPERAATAEVKPALPQNWDMPSKEQLAAIVDERIAMRPGASMVVSVIDGGNTRTLARGAEDISDQTVFEIGSMTKVFTSLLLADLVLDGTVSLDDPVAKYLPGDATMPTRGGKQITLRNLSQQDSGLPRLPDNLSPADMGNPYADYTEELLIAFLKRYELTRDIGREYEYSNLGVGLLGYALAQAAGVDFETLLRQRVLAPLGMNDTAIKLSPDQRTRFVRGFDEYMQPASAWDFSVLAGAGAMRSTAADMEIFLRAALDPASPIAKAMTLMTSQTREATGYTVGLGWIMASSPGGKVLWHNGGTGGFRSFMALQPDKDRATLVLTNTAVEPSATDIGMHVLIGTPVAKAKAIPRAPSTVARDAVKLSTANLDRVVGTYRFAPNVDLTITREGDQLMAAITGQGALPIFPRSQSEFFWRAVNAQIVLIEENGKIVGATFTQDGSSSPLVRVD